MKRRYTPPCLSDAPPQVLQLADYFAAALVASLRQSIMEELPDTGIQELNDIMRGSFLIAAEKCQAITIGVKSP